MDRSYIDMHLLVDRYVQGSLVGRELEEFEERLVWDQALVDETKLAEILREGLKQSASDDQYSITRGGSRVSGWFSELISVPTYAAAASFILATVATTGLLLGPLSPDQDISIANSLPIEIVPLVTTRSESLPSVTIDENTRTVLLIDVLGTYDTYRVSFFGDEPDVDTLFKQDGLKPTYLGTLAIGLPGDLSTPGRYLLRVEGAVLAQSGDVTYENVQDIRFETSAVR